MLGLQDFTPYEVYFEKFGSRTASADHGLGRLVELHRTGVQRPKRKRDGFADRVTREDQGGPEEVRPDTERLFRLALNLSHSSRVISPKIGVQETWLWRSRGE